MKKFFLIFLSLFLNVSYAGNKLDIIELKNLNFNNPLVIEKANLLKINNVSVQLYSHTSKKLIANDNFNIWEDSYSNIGDGLFFELNDNPVSFCGSNQSKEKCNVIYPMIKIYTKTIPEDEFEFKKSVAMCFIDSENCNAKINIIFEKTYIYELVDLFISNYSDLKKFTTSSMVVQTIDFKNSKLEDLLIKKSFKLDFSKYEDKNTKNKYDLFIRLGD